MLLHTQVNGSSQADSREPQGMEAEEAQEIQAAEALIAQKGSVTGPADEEGLAEFSRMLSVFTHCGRLKVIAQLLRPSNQHSSSILSSIEFDRDSEVHPPPSLVPISMYYLDPWLHDIFSARPFGSIHLSSSIIPAFCCSQSMLDCCHYSCKQRFSSSTTFSSACRRLRHGA